MATVREKTQSLGFETERSEHEKVIKEKTELLKKAQEKLNGAEVVQNSGLRRPSEVRKEVQEIA